MRPLALLLAAAGLLLGSCGKKEDPPKGPPTASGSAPLPAPGAPLPLSPPPPERPKPPPAGPVELLTSVNGLVQAGVTEGWPVVVETRLALRPASPSPLVLRNPAGPWGDALRIECRGPGDRDRSALFKPAYASEKGIELTRERSGLMVWVLDAVDLAQLPQGSYRIRAILDESKVTGALPPGLASFPVLLGVGPAPAAPTPAEVRRKCLAQMSAAGWKSDFPNALATGQAYLAEHPKDVAVLILQGKIHRAQGGTADALASFEAALQAAEERKERGGENFAIQELILDLRREKSPK